jgi:hypothetical protein
VLGFCTDELNIFCVITASVLEIRSPNGIPILFSCYSLDLVMGFMYWFAATALISYGNLHADDAWCLRFHDKWFVIAVKQRLWLMMIILTVSPYFINTCLRLELAFFMRNIWGECESTNESVWSGCIVRSSSIGLRISTCICMCWWAVMRFVFEIDSGVWFRPSSTLLLSSLWFRCKPSKRIAQVLGVQSRL